jgi:hypothetical protein
MRKNSIRLIILRLSMIYPNERNHNKHILLCFIRRSCIYRTFGDLFALMHPGHVEVLTEGIAQAVARDAHGEFKLAGPGGFSYRKRVGEVFHAVGRRGVMVFVPVPLVVFLAGLLECLSHFPVDREQVIRLQEDKAFGIRASKDKLDYRPRPFVTGIAQEAEQIRRAGLL